GLLRADEMDVRVDAACSRDEPLSGDDLRPRTDHDVDARLHIRVPTLTDGGEAAALHADVRFDDPPVVYDERVRDDEVHRLVARGLALSHPVADDLAAAELHLLAVDGSVLLYGDPEVRIGKAYAIPHGGPVHGGVCGSRDPRHFAFSSGPWTLP